MNKIIRRTGCFLLSLATVFTIIGCGKKTTKINKTTKANQSTTNRTTTNQVTTKVVKNEASVSINSNLDDVTVKAYDLSDGKELDLTKKYATNTKIKVEILNASNKNISISTSLGQNSSSIEVESKTRKVLDEITLTDDLSITTAESELVFVHLNNDEYVTFSGYYYDKNNKKVEFDSSIAVEKNTKVYLKVTNDSVGDLTCIATQGDTILDVVTCRGKGGHNPQTAQFTDEGIAVDNNIKVTYRNGDDGEIYPNCDVESVSVVYKDAKTNTVLESASSWMTCYEVGNSAEVKGEISNPNAKKLAIVFTDSNGVFNYLITEETSYTFNFITLGAISVNIYEYNEYTFSISNTDKLDAYFYYYDVDGMEIEVKDGDKVKVGIPVNFIITNNSIYEAKIESESYDDSWDYTLPARDTFDSKITYYSTYALSNVNFKIELTDTVTKFYTVTFEAKVTIPSGLNYRLGYHRGMYDYPIAEFNTNIVAGKEMAVVIENTSGVQLTLRIYNSDTDEPIKTETIYGETSCAATFTLDSNVKVVIE